MKTRARLVVVALIAIGLFALMCGQDGILRTLPQISPSNASGHGMMKVRQPAMGVQALPALPRAAQPGPALPSDASYKAAGTLNAEMSIGHSSEPNPNIGDVFRLEISTDVQRPAARVTVTLNYDPLMLHLVGVRSSDSVVRPADIANFAVLTPGNAGQVVISWDGRSIAGRGVLGHVEFELHAPGSSDVTLSDVEVVDVHGVTIEVPIPKPFHVERHLS